MRKFSLTPINSKSEIPDVHYFVRVSGHDGDLEIHAGPTSDFSEANLLMWVDATPGDGSLSISSAYCCEDLQKLGFTKDSSSGCVRVIL